MASTTANPTKRKNDDVEQSQTKRFRFACSDMITVLVGAHEHRFTVHQDLICDSSDFFKAACNGAWKGAGTKTVTLRDVEQYCFKMYVEWLYDRTVDLFDLAHTCEMEFLEATQDVMPYKPDSIATHIVCQLWVLADFLGDETLKNSAVDMVERHITLLGRWLRTRTAAYVVDNSTPQSGLRRLMIALIVARLKPENLERIGPTMAPSLVLELLKALVAKQERGSEQDTGNNVDRCKYHEHKIESAKCA
ncbi:hypothetical protein LTR36_005553 [Oleoguttula mirabilis]|uniref:BTB domain-containing protein n=1 Tax=Oleoguttula mirabilis TaxID=1507867 RepID=A0AAV9JEG6_9PEZI|nr:hypothetical protein LTR36_005553 [Oleoguttula mirabilis]